MPISKASNAKLVHSEVETRQPTIRRKNTSSTNAAYTQPENVRI